jgi:hypothetical protein
MRCDSNLKPQMHKIQQLPTAFIEFLTSSHIIKAGRNVKGDITRLCKQFGIVTPLAGLLDILQFCRARKLLNPNQPNSLASIAEQVINVHLPKEAVPRLSDSWEYNELSSENLTYAALDIFAISKVYQAAAKVPIPEGVSVTTPPNTAVTLMSGDGTQPIALARVYSGQQPNRHENIVVKTQAKSRLLVVVETVLTPSAGALLYIPSKAAGRSAGLTEKQRKATMKMLSEFGPTPFNLVAPIASLQLGHVNDVQPSLDPLIQSHQSDEAILNARQLDASGPVEEVDEPLIDMEDGLPGDSMDLADEETGNEMQSVWNLIQQDFNDSNDKDVGLAEDILCWEESLNQPSQAADNLQALQTLSNDELGKLVKVYV